MPFSLVMSGVKSFSPSCTLSRPMMRPLPCSFTAALVNSLTWVTENAVLSSIVKMRFSLA